MDFMVSKMRKHRYDACVASYDKIEVTFLQVRNCCVSTLCMCGIVLGICTTGVGWWYSCMFLLVGGAGVFFLWRLFGSRAYLRRCVHQDRYE